MSIENPNFYPQSEQQPAEKPPESVESAVQESTESEQTPEISIEQEKAQRFWEARLKGEARIEKPQNPQCEFSIVVPVHNEKPERVLRQIESLRNQNIDPSTFEIIYVINNDIADESRKSQEAIANNKAVIEALKSLQDSNIFFIDKSSAGNEIIKCNVGKARNRGIAEASLRFHERQTNGILIQSDADSYFEDPDYLSKIRDTIKQNPDTVGIAGGLIFEFDPDTTDPREIEALKQKLEKFNLLREWHFMSRFLRDPETPLLFQGNIFSGANMISKSLETAVLGGLDDVSISEDVNFGENLKNYASGRGQVVLGKRQELRVVTALRESDRTGASFKKYFDEIDLEKPLMGHDPLAPDINEVRQKILDQIIANLHNPDGLRKALSDRQGNLIFSEAGFNALVEYLGKQDKLNLADPFLTEWSQKYFGETDPFQDMYDEMYPNVPITKDALKTLEDKIIKYPSGQKFIENMRANLTGVRVKPI